ncbi:MAG TPA: HD-GYP domain-containing protein [Clostridiales bacterium]|nr:HD-GYP domain-containing protein [Clostridiales bacterium]
MRNHFLQIKNVLKRFNLKYFYVYLIGFSVFPLISYSTPHINFKGWFHILFWIILELAADLKPFRSIFYLRMDMTLSFSVQLAMIILLNTWEAVWIVIVATIIAELISKKEWYKAMFNAGQYGLSLLVTSFVFNLLKMSPNDIPLDIIKDLPAIIASVIVYYFMNTLFISIVISLFYGNKFIDVFFNDYKIMAAFYFSITPISIAASLLYQESHPYKALILIPPLIMADQSIRRYYSLHMETIETLNVLADIIDERDSYTYSHSSRVAEYSGKIAQELHLSSDAINEVETAGRVHDVGKIAIEDSILRKDGKLTTEEYDNIKKHPEVAYRLLKNLKPYKNGAKYALYHHEKIDGTGYPENLSGRSIPLGARILAVADCYDAMTSDRPYRKALPQSTAIKELLKYSGAQFDPVVVKAFIEVLKRDYGYFDMDNNHTSIDDKSDNEYTVTDDKTNDKCNNINDKGEIRR